MNNLSFDVSKAEAQTLRAIAERASALAKKHGIKYPVMTANMDVTAVHANGNPLRLGELLAADEFNFAHDVFGIRRHLNRVTGQLMDCFLPRFTA